MKYAKPCLIALLINLLDIVALFTLIGPLLVFVMLLLGQRWKWLLTPDVELPGDLSLPAVKSIHERYGAFWCSWYWLALRNRWHGLDFAYAVRLPLAWDQSAFGLQEQGALWWLRYPIGRLQFKAGYRLYVIDGLPYGVPCCTITKA